MDLIRAILQLSLRNRPVVLLAAVLFVALGVQSAMHLPIDAVPDITNVQVQIITSSPALSPVEIEQYVTIPVERAMSGLPKAVQVRSLSKYGVSLVTVVFNDDTPLYLARQLVAERMREAEDAVPALYGKPEMGPISSGLGEVFQFVVRGPSLMEVEETLDFYIEPRLRGVPGIVEVNSLGGEDREYQVVIDPGKLQAAGLSVREVVEAIRRSNANAGGGYVEHSSEQIVIGTDGLLRSLEDLQTVVVSATPHGIPVTLANVADVRFGPRLRRGAASMDGQGEVAVGVAMMLIGENSRTVTAAVKRKIAEIGASLPPGVRIEPFYDRAALVSRTVSTVAHSLGEGAVLVILVLLFLLRDVRAGLIVASTIPLSMLFAIVLMNAHGASGNLMSLGAIDFGLLVDGAVIIVENAVRHLHGAQQQQAAALTAEQRLAIVSDAAIEVLSATVFGQAIIALVYLPILVLSGVEGKLFQPMALTVLYALGGAFILSITLIPVLCSLLLRPYAGDAEGLLLRKVQALYEPLLARSIRFPVITMTVGALLLGVGAIAGSRLGAEFIPQLDEGDLVVEVRRLPGVALSESLRIDRRMQQVLLTIPEVAHVVSRTGSAQIANDPMGLEQTDVYVLLKPRPMWRPGLSKTALGQQLIALLAQQIPEAAVALSQPIQMRTNELVAGVRSDVAAILYGPDLRRLRTEGEKLAAVLARVRGVTDVRVEQAAGLRYLRVRPDRARLARYGLTIDDVNQLVQTTAVGFPASVVLEGDRRFAVVVKTAVQYAGALDALHSLPLKSALGQMVPLGDVAELKLENGPVEVNREKQSRRLIVEFNVRGRDLVSVVAEAQQLVAAQLRLPVAYHIEWGGEFQHYLEARDRLVVVVPLGLTLILFLLWLALRSVRPALLIFCNVPFSAVGGAVALWLRGIPFSISAAVGFIALFGVAVLNGLVLVTFSRRLEATGLAPGQAIRQAGQLRLRPVLMTALVAALGFVPMALSEAPGSEVQRPLATVVIGGLLTATFLTLLLLPAVYQLAYRQTKSPGPESSGT